MTFVGNNNFINGNAITDVPAGNVASNYSALEQVGTGNKATIDQVLANPSKCNIAEFDQAGGACAEIDQDGQRLVTKADQGAGSELYATSSGTAHDVAVRQDANMYGSTNLGGTDNEVALDQYGSGNEAMVDVDQLGTGNTLSLDQTDGVNATVSQNGTSNTSVVIQN